MTPTPLPLAPLAIEGKGFGGLPGYSEYGFPQTRGFRALKLWMTLQHMGRSGVAALVRRHVVLARRLASAVDRAPDLERVAPPWSCRSCASATGRGDGPGTLPGSTRSTGPWWSGSKPTGGSSSRAPCSGAGSRSAPVILHYGTTEADVDALVDVVRETGAHLAADA